MPQIKYPDISNFVPISDLVLLLKCIKSKCSEIPSTDRANNSILMVLKIMSNISKILRFCHGWPNYEPL